MKKLLLLSICLFTAMHFGFSQESRITKGTGKNKHPMSSNRGHIKKPNIQAAFWSDDFSNAGNWIPSNQVGNSDDWVIGTGIPSGPFAIPAIASTTAANGYALFDSDLLCSGDQIADIENLNAIDCSTHGAVSLSFEQTYERYNDSTFVYVSTNGSTWTKFSVNETATNNVISLNPEIVQVDISSVAANQATVFIRFEFWSPTTYVGPGASGPGCAYSWMIDDVSLSEPSSLDGGVTAILSPVSGCLLSTTSQVTATITNFGIATISNFPISMTLNGGTAITETVAASIPYLGTYDYTFTATLNLSTATTYAINVYTALVGDVDPTNDLATVNITSSAPNNLTTPLTMGFEPLEDLSSWAVQDVNGDATTWAIVNTNVQSGTQAIRKAGSAVEDDDWLFTPCLQLTAGVNYSLSYWFKNFELVTPCKFEVSVGAGQDALLMTQSIIQHTIPADTTYSHGTPTFSVATTGNYNIGFHAYMAPGAGGSSSLRLDNIAITVVTGLNETHNDGGVNVYPNPSNGLLNLSVKKYNNATLHLYNAVGKEVLNQKLNSLDSKIDMTNFANGFYVLHVTSPDFTYSEKITLNK